MRSWISALSLLVSVAVSSAQPIGPGGAPGATPPAAPTPITVLSPELKAKILQAMRLNRQAFQASEVLQRYGETRHRRITRRSSRGSPANEHGRAGFPIPGVQGAHDEAHISRGRRLQVRRHERWPRRKALEAPRAPLLLHPAGVFPGHPALLHVPAAPEEGIGDTKCGRRRRLHARRNEGEAREKLELLGPRSGQSAGRSHCVRLLRDRRPPASHQERADRRQPRHRHDPPTPTRPTCWIVQTQADLFQGLMGGVIDPPVDDQIALLKEYYDCKNIKGKIPEERYKAFCEIDPAEFQ